MKYFLAFVFGAPIVAMFWVGAARFCVEIYCDTRDVIRRRYGK